MSADRVIFSFVLGWVALVGVLIALDWLSNPNRGTFRPKGERPPRDRKTRRAERVRRRLEDDASVRAALRDAYGASSLRLNWTNDQESDVRRLDDELVVEHRPGSLEATSYDVTTIDQVELTGDPMPNIEETPTPETVPAETETQEPPRGWTVGGDPLVLTAKGDEPAAATVRSRVWKNLGTLPGWTEQNLERLSAGKAPLRKNPVTGVEERAIVDIASGQASWGDEPIDPFEIHE